MSTRTWTGTVSGDWGVTSNWAEGAVPVSGDDVYFTGSSASVTAGLNQSAVALASLNIDPTFTGQIGTASAYLQVASAVTNLAAGASAGGAPAAGPGSGRVKLDHGASANVTNAAFSAASGADAARGLPAVQLLGSNLTLNQTGGSVSVAAGPGETAALASARLGRGSAGLPEPSLLIGPGCTVSDLRLSAGVVVNRTRFACPAVRLEGGAYDYRGSGAHTVLDVDRGAAYYSGTGTLTTANVAGTLDFSRDPRPKTVTHCNLFRGATLNADNGNPLSVAFTNGVALQRCGVEDVAVLKLGSHVALALSGA